MNERYRNGNNHLYNHNRAFSTLDIKGRKKGKRKRTPVPKKPPKVETPDNKYDRKKHKKETIKMIKGILLAVLLSVSTLFAQVSAIASVSWEASINPDVDRIIILVWTGVDPLQCPLFEDSLISSIDPLDYESLTRIDTVNALALNHIFQTTQNGELMRIAGAFVNTSNIESRMATSVFAYIPGRPLKPTYIELEFTIE